MISNIKDFMLAFSQLFVTVNCFSSLTFRGLNNFRGDFSTKDISLDKGLHTPLVFAIDSETSWSLRD